VVDLDERIRQAVLPTEEVPLGAGADDDEPISLDD
jgi:hypothetical protein